MIIKTKYTFCWKNLTIYEWINIVNNAFYLWLLTKIKGTLLRNKKSKIVKAHFSQTKFQINPQSYFSIIIRLIENY